VSKWACAPVSRQVDIPASSILKNRIMVKIGLLFLLIDYAPFPDLRERGNSCGATNVETALPNDMWELRSKLLGDSPHLSMDVLKKAADKTEVLPDNVIFEVMAANPDEMKKDEMIKYLEDKENPLPGYMVDILRQVATGTTYKTVLEQQMAGYNQAKTRAAHDIVRSILNDSVTDYNELRNWLDNIGGKRADEQIIAIYMQEANYIDALALANTMPAFYNYAEHELIEHNYYLEMLNLQIGLAQNGRSIFDLDATEVSNLVSIAENSQGTAEAQAKGILEFAYGYDYCNCLNATDSTGYKSSGIINPKDLAQVYGLDVNTKPNPAKDWVAFNYTLPTNESEGVIKIVDAKGTLANTIVISGKQGQKIWDIRNIKPGVYFYTLNVAEFTKSGKIIIGR
jgi:hypothetical protein